MIYDKIPISIDDQINRLKGRGLIISDTDAAKHALSHISYYRLVGYWYPMYEDKVAHTFKTNSKFEDVLALYKFDHALRMILFDAIEKIEISLRTKLVYHLSHECDPWWFQDHQLFADIPALSKTLFALQEEVERSKDTFMKEHRKKYKDDKRFPPAWKTLELTSFGGLSKLYGNLKNTISSKDTIAKEFGAVNHTFLPSWLQSIAQIRNLCAHHARLWNKNLPGTVKLLSKAPYPWLNDIPKQHEFQQLYVHICLMKYLLNIIHPTNMLKEELEDLLKKYPSVDHKALGLKDNWQNEPLWS